MCYLCERLDGEEDVIICAEPAAFRQNDKNPVKQSRGRCTSSQIHP